MCHNFPGLLPLKGWERCEDNLEGGLLFPKPSKDRTGHLTPNMVSDMVSSIFWCILGYLLNGSERFRTVHEPYEVYV